MKDLKLNGYIFLLLIMLSFSVRAQKKDKSSGVAEVSRKYMEMITHDELSAQTHFIASDYFEGRKAGTKNERATAYYLATYYKSLGIPPPAAGEGADLESYFQHFSFMSGTSELQSQNVLGFIEGTDPQLKKDVIVLVAHYDHLGKDTTSVADPIFNGAADDASGTAALLEIAESFAEAKRSGLGSKRSLLFLHAGAEETGMLGSAYYVNNPLKPLEQIVTVINLDGVGGTDKPAAANAGNYVYLLYNDSTSLPFAQLTNRLNATTGINLDILKPENPGRYNSDNKPFEYELLPSVYFSSGLTEHYHKPSDEPSTIDYGHMEKITRLIFSVAWELSHNQKIETPGVVKRDQFEKTNLYYCLPCGCASDKKDFTKAGVCPDCRMTLQPKWRKK